MTFLFTDIEGSTRRWEEDAVAMRAALSKHDKTLRDAIEEHDGFVFSHTGDGVVAAFASPRSAVDAAVEAQLALELPVRMGIATGEAELREGDYFGAVLNRAARVMAAGHGGQILVADSTASRLSGVDLLDLGPCRLRDLPSPVEVFQVRVPNLPDFPPLRTQDTSNLVDPPARSWRRRLRPYFLPIATLAILIPNLLAAAYNIQHNQLLIVNKLSAQAQGRFVLVTALINLVLIPLATAVLF